MNIIWLASYPKSGNTWLRFFLYNYIYGDIQDSNEVAYRIPDIHRIGKLNTEPPGTIFCKTHFMFSDKHPYLKQTTGFIYLLRHPRDILLSSLHYCRMEGDNFEDSQFALDFIEHSGVIKWRDVGMGSWIEHVESWLANPSFPFILLRYEDILESPNTQFKRVIDGLNLDFDEKRFKHAINSSSFTQMKKLEVMEKLKQHQSLVFNGDAKGSDNLYFMNKGKKNLSLEQFGSEIELLFNKRFNNILKRLDYL